MRSLCDRFVSSVRSILRIESLLPVVAVGCIGLGAGLLLEAAEPAGGTPAPAAHVHGARAQAATPTVPVDPNNPPKFRCDEPVHTFAEVWSGEKVNHTYVIHNDGTGPLEIVRVQPACGCTLAGEFTKIIQPGGQGTIPVSLNTANMPADLSKTITVETNDPQNQRVTLTIKGKIKSRIALEPLAGANFARLTPATPESMTIKVTNNMPTPMKLEPVPDQPKTAFTATINEVEPGRVAEVVIKHEKPYQDGQNMARLRFTTGVPEQAELQIPANLYAPPLIEVTPPGIMATTNPTQGHNQAISILYNGEGELKILSVEPSDSAIEVELQERQAGKAYGIALKLPAGFSTPNEQPANLVVKTDSQERPTIEIPVRARLVLPVVQAQSLIGKSAITVGIKSTDGKDVIVGADNGKVKVLNFWTTWCPHCHKQLPIIQRLAESYKDKDVEFLNVSVGPRANTPTEVDNAVRRLNLSMPVAVDQAVIDPATKAQVQAAASKYGAGSFPTLFLIGKNNVIESLHRGSSRQGSAEALEQQLRAELDVLLAGKDRNDFPKPAPAVAATPPAPAQPPEPAAPARQGPALTIQNLTPDLGLQNPDSSVAFNLQYQNDGTEPVSVTAVEAGEGVTLEPGFTRLVQPGATGELRGQIRAPAEPGTFSRQVTIESSDRSRPRQVVTLNATARPYFEFLPPAGVIFSRNIRTHAIPGMATLAYYGPGTASYETPESSSPNFEAYVEPIANGPYAKLIVKAQPPFEIGENKATLRIRTNNERQPVLEVPVQLYLPPRVEIEPAAVVVPPSPRLQRSVVTIKNNGDTPISMCGVKASSDKINWQFYPEADGLSYKLVLTLPAQPNLSTEGERVVIRTDDEEHPEIVIPIRISEEEPSRAVSQAPPR